MKAQKNNNKFTSAQKPQLVLLTEDRRKRAKALLQSINELVADNRNKIKTAHEIISANKGLNLSEDHNPEKNPKNAGSSASEQSDENLRELCRNMEKQKADLLQAKEELEQFAYAASHDLQEPLRMITGFLTQLDKKYTHLLDDTGKEYIGHAVAGAKRMRQSLLLCSYE